MTERRGYWLHQWFNSLQPITVYYDDQIVAEYAGRFKLLRAWLYMLLHPRAQSAGSQK